MADEISSELVLINDELELRNKLASEISKALSSIVSLQENVITNKESRTQAEQHEDHDGAQNTV